jgi:hypothetical protein
MLLRAVPRPDYGFQPLAVARPKPDLDALPHLSRIAYRREGRNRSSVPIHAARLPLLSEMEALRQQAPHGAARQDYLAAGGLRDPRDQLRARAHLATFDPANGRGRRLGHRREPFLGQAVARAPRRERMQRRSRPILAHADKSVTQPAAPDQCSQTY